MLGRLLHSYEQRATYDLLVLYHIGALENSIHFIFDKQSKECVIIDPAWQASLFLDIIKEKGYTLTQIWLTHWHPDHVNATDELVQRTGAIVIAGEYEEGYLQLQSQITYVVDGAKLQIGKTTATVIYTPGHSKGGVCYLLSDDIIAGDTLFIYGAGHCQLPGASVDDFYHSMQKIKKMVPDEVYLRCGHNYGDKLTTTMAEQKQYNAYLILDDKQDLLAFISGMAAGRIAYPTGRATKKALLSAL